VGIGLYEIEWTEFSKEDHDSLDGSQKIFVDNKAIQEHAKKEGSHLSIQ
jgi:hypothetical protein